MTDDFDPYYTWLGIPPEEQPSTHYRLLGIRPFESNLDVISNAGDQRMAFLRTFQVGKRSALSQRLLNEVAAAKVCLLDPDRRRVYDETLKASQPKPIAPAPQVKPSNSPPSLVMAPSRQTLVARSMPIAPNSFPAVDSFADVPLAAKPAPRQAGNRYVDQFLSFAGAAVRRVQDAPLAAAAYGLLALGVMMFLSVVVWVSIRAGAEPNAIVAANLPTAAPSGEAAPATNSTSKDSTATPSATVSSVVATGNTLPAATSPVKPPPQKIAPAPTMPSPLAPASSAVVTSMASPATAASPTASPGNKNVDYSPLVRVLKGPFFAPGQQSQLSPSGKYLAVWQTMEPSIRVFNLNEGTPPLELKEPNGFGLTCACFSDYDEQLVCAGNRNIVTWDIQSGRLLWQDSRLSPVRAIAFWNGTSQLAVACEGKQCLCLLDPGRSIVKLVSASSKSVSKISVGNDWLAVLWKGGQVQLFNLKFGTFHKTLPNPHRIPFERVFVVHDEVIAVDAKGYQVWDAKAGIQKSFWESRHAPLMHPSFAFVPGGLFAMQERGQLKLVRFPEDFLNGTLSWPGGKFTYMELSMSGKRLLTSGPDGDLLVWDVDELKSLKTCTMYTPQQLADFASVYSKRVTNLDSAQGGTASLAGLPKTESGSALPAPVPMPAGPQATAALSHLKSLGIQNLPENPRDLTYLNINNSRFTNEDAQCLAALPALEGIFMRDQPITGEGLKLICACPRLKILDLTKTQIVDDDLVHVVKAVNLETLRVPETKVTAAGVVHLKGLTHLEQLSLPRNVGREVISTIAGWPAMRNFDPWPAGITDQDMAQLSKLERLNSVNLSQAQLTVEGYSHLAKMHEVTNIQLPVNVPAGICANFSQMKLQSFSFPRSTVDEDLTHFTEMESLQFVYAPAQLTDEGMKHLAKIRNLNNLMLTISDNVTDEGLKHLTSLKKLQTLALSHHFTDAGMVHIAKIKSLEQVNLVRNSPVTERGIAMLATLPNLRALTVSSGFTNDGIEIISRIKTLESFSVNDADLSSQSIKKLAGLKNLQSLGFVGVKLAKEDVETLNRCTHLKHLSLYTCGLSQGEIDEIRKSLPSVNLNASP